MQGALEIRVTPLERSRKVLEGLDVRLVLEHSGLPVEIATAIADLCEHRRPEVGPTWDIDAMLGAFDAGLQAAYMGETARRQHRQKFLASLRPQRVHSKEDK